MLKYRNDIRNEHILSIRNIKQRSAVNYEQHISMNANNTQT